jgi:mannose-6-phosphate isomerase-like protein (cupin superfamily)
MVSKREDDMTGTPIRRVVTGHNGEGRSIIIQDQATPHVKTSPHRPGVVINNLWMTDRMPAPTAAPDDAAHVGMALAPVAGGINFRIVEFPPESEYLDKISAEDAAKAFGDMGAADALAGEGHATKSGSQHPFMHKTETLDFAIIVSGEVYLVLDDEETLMKAGDVCIQRATNHVWSNRSDKPCRIAFMLIDGEKA